MELVNTLTDTTMDYGMAVEQRRTVLSLAHDALPSYASAAFWQTIADVSIPLEVLVKLLRKAHASGDEQGRGRIVEQIFQRTQAMNKYWAYTVLRHIPLHSDERYALVNDLCADLHECMLRALIDIQRPFWEENFLHCLYFERKHVYRTFMIREGWWQSQQGKRGARVPRAYVASLDQLLGHMDGQSSLFDVEDEQAQIMLQSVERSDLLRFVLHLPDRLKAVILLLFWEGRSEKDAAQVLGISDRTVRNRLRTALQMLRDALRTERESSGFYE